MFSLIITVVSIALVAVLALATLYYGGSAFERGRAESEAARLTNQAEQLMGAAELFRVDHGRQPDDLAELVATRYLKAIPVAGSGMQVAMADGGLWRMVVQGNLSQPPAARVGADREGIPVFVLDTPSATVCQAFNEKSFGLNGVLATVHTGLIRQCYGTATTALKSMAARNPQLIAEAIAAEQVALASPGSPAAMAFDSDVTFAGAVVGAGLPLASDAAAWLIAPGVPGVGGPPEEGPGEPPAPVTPAQLVFDEGASAAFGSVLLGTPASTTLTLRNTGGAPATGVAVAVVGPAALAVTSSTCGTPDAPVTLQAAQSCSVTVSFGSSEAVTLENAYLNVSGQFSNNAGLAIALTGNAYSNLVTSQWGAGPNSLTAPETSFGTEVEGTPAVGSFYLHNTNLVAPLISSFALTGDTTEFELVSVSRVESNGGTQGCGATVTPTSATACTGTVPGEGTKYHIRVDVRYKRASVGSHSVTLTPSTTAHVSLPSPLTLTGTTQAAPVYSGIWFRSQMATTTVGQKSDRAVTPLPASGKWYWEVTATAGSYPLMGIGAAGGIDNSYPGGSTPGSYASSCGYFLHDGSIYVNGGSKVGGSKPNSSQTIGVAYDAPTRTAVFYRGGVQSGSCTVTGTTALYPAAGGGSPSSHSFGLNATPATVPGGYQALSLSAS